MQSESYVIENKLEKLTQAKVLFNEAKYEAALPLLDDVLSVGADNPRTLFIRGAAYERMSRLELAVADFKRATELAPFYYGAWNELGMVQIRMGLLSEAIQSLTAAIDASPEANEVAQANRATAYILSGQAATGIRELQSLFQEKGSDSTGLLLALACLSTNESEAYHGVCKEFLNRISSKSSDGTNGMAVWVCSIAPNAVSEYDELLRIAKELYDKDREFALRLGAILFRAGKPEQALEYLLEASDATPTNDSKAYLGYFLAMTQHALGQKDLAIELLNRANTFASQELSVGIKPLWNRQVTLELLRAETIKVVLGEK